jgi:hypothetical protein
MMVPGFLFDLEPRPFGRVRSFGGDFCKIVEYRFGNPNIGDRAKFEFMRFEVELSWPAEFVPFEES